MLSGEFKKGKKDSNESVLFGEKEKKSRSFGFAPKKV
jgi:hypothetical protein